MQNKSSSRAKVWLNTKDWSDDVFVHEIAIPGIGDVSHYPKSRGFSRAEEIASSEGFAWLPVGARSGCRARFEGTGARRRGERYD